MFSSLLHSQDHSSAESGLVQQLQTIVGRRHVLVTPNQQRRYTTGFRFGRGRVLAVVRPASLIEQWRVLQACIQADTIVIPQAANTGLTGGSTPDGETYDRDVVVISLMRLRSLQLIHQGHQVLCCPGVTLDQLEKSLAPLGREPHSVIGSSCLGASVLGGICNNSGGSLVKRGPAFTQLALYGQVDEQGQLHLINHLGIDLGPTDDPEALLHRLEKQDFRESDIHDTDASASDHDYAAHVRHIEAETPARFNADPRRLFEASGCAGKLMVFAVRLDTFPAEKQTQVLYIGTNNPDDLTEVRRHILAEFRELPVSAEYMHREAFDIAEKYGKDTFLMIEWLGTKNLPFLFGLKARVDGVTDRFKFLPNHLSDRSLQLLSHLFPSHLPKRMKDYRDRYEHHLLLKVSATGLDEARGYLQTFFTKEAHPAGDFFECTADEGKKAFLHRFAAAGAAVRYRAVHPNTVEDIVALDIALRRNDTQWVEHLPDDIQQGILSPLYYGHFLCYVFHQDYIIRKGVNCLDLEHRMWELLEQRGAQYPAEHNVGHLYVAKPQQASFYRKLDPINAFNPGIGQTSRKKHWH